MLCFVTVLQQLEHQVVTHPSTSKYNKIKEKYDELFKEHKYTKVSMITCLIYKFNRQKSEMLLVPTYVLDVLTLSFVCKDWISFGERFYFSTVVFVWHICTYIPESDIVGCSQEIIFVFFERTRRLFCGLERPGTC